MSNLAGVCITFSHGSIPKNVELQVEASSSLVPQGPAENQSICDAPRLKSKLTRPDMS